MEKTVLVIDSDPHELRKLRELLTRERYNILTASDEPMARQLCKSIQIDFVLARAAEIGFGQTK